MVRGREEHVQVAFPQAFPWRKVTVTLTLDEGTPIQYKYTRGSWTYVEKGAACEEIANRTATIVYGADGTMALDDTVLNWRNTGPCPD